MRERSKNSSAILKRSNDSLGGPEIMGSRTVVFRIIRLPYLVWVEGRGIKNTLAKKVLVDSVDTQSDDPLFVFLPL